MSGFKVFQDCGSRKAPAILKHSKSAHFSAFPFFFILCFIFFPSQKYFRLVIWAFPLHISAISANSPSSSLLDNTCENAYPVQRGLSYAKQARTERSPAPASMLISLCL